MNKQKEIRNIIELMFELRNSNDDKEFIYVQENPLTHGFDYSYAYKDNDEYVISIVDSFTNHPIPFKFKESKSNRIICEYSDFKIIESKYEYNKERIIVMNLILKESSFNENLYIINEFLDLNNRYSLFNVGSTRWLSILKRWLKYTRNNEDFELIPNVIAGLNLLRFLYPKNESTRLLIVENDAIITQNGKTLSGLYSFNSPEFRIHLDYSTDLYSKLELDRNGKSINNLTDELSSVLDKKYYKELSILIDGIFGNKEMNPLDRNIPYKITFKEIKNVK